MVTRIRPGWSDLKTNATIDGGTIDVASGVVTIDGIATSTVKVRGEATNVPDNVRTTILTKVADSNFNNISIISVSGEDYAKFFLVYNTIDLDIRRTGPDRNLQFDYTGSPLALTNGDIIDVQVEHFAPDLLDFECTIYGYGNAGWRTGLPDTVEATLTLNAPNVVIV